MPKEKISPTTCRSIVGRLPPSGNRKLPTTRTSALMRLPSRIDHTVGLHRTRSSIAAIPIRSTAKSNSVSTGRRSFFCSSDGEVEVTPSTASVIAPNWMADSGTP